MTTEGPSSKGSYAQVDLVALIHEVHSRPPLWNPHVIIGKETLDRLWWEVADTFEATDKFVKTKWKFLKDGYRRELKKTVEQPGFQPTWPYYDMLYFLRDVILQSKRISFSSDDVVFPNNCLQTEIESVQNGEYEVVVISEPETIFSPKRRRQAENESVDKKTTTTSTGSQDKTNSVDANVKSVPAVSKSNKTASKVESVENEPPSCPKDSKCADKVPKESLDVAPTLDPRNPWGCCTVDEDTHFFMSLVPHMKRFNSLQKLRIRNRIQQILIEEITEDSRYDPASSSTEPKK